ncbi:hypothetical protein LINPERHAP2_LOCUS14419, partial [Linum perenne]
SSPPPPSLLPSPSLLPPPFSSILFLHLLSLLILPPPSPFSSCSSSLLICLLPPRNSSIENLDLNISVPNVSPLFHSGTFCCRSKRFSTFISMRKRRREGEEWRKRVRGGRNRGEGGSEV